jgi:hypothetical protein
VASLKTKQRSPYWYIKYRDEGGHLVEKSTNLRKDSAKGTRQAKILKAKRTKEELENSNADPMRGRWDTWVPGYIQVRYEQADKTKFRNQVRWDNFMVFLNLKEISRVQLLKREHAVEYMQWRKAGCKERRKPLVETFARISPYVQGQPQIETPDISLHPRFFYHARSPRGGGGGHLNHDETCQPRLRVDPPHLSAVRFERYARRPQKNQITDSFVINGYVEINYRPWIKDRHSDQQIRYVFTANY